MYKCINIQIIIFYWAFRELGEEWVRGLDEKWVRGVCDKWVRGLGEEWVRGPIRKRKRGPKAPNRAQRARQPSTGARRRAAVGCPNLLVLKEYSIP